MVALYDYAAQGPEDLDFSEGDTIDILGEGETRQPWLAAKQSSHVSCVSSLSGSERGVVGRSLCRNHRHLPQVLRLQGERRRDHDLTALRSEGHSHLQ